MLFLPSQPRLYILLQRLQIRQLLRLQLRIRRRLLYRPYRPDKNRPSLLLEHLLLLGCQVVAHAHLLEGLHDVAVLHEELDEEGFLGGCEVFNVAVG